MMSLREKLKVLVVDDMSTGRGLIVQGLDAIGITNVWSTDNATAATGAIDHAPVHLVNSDFNRPDVNGLQFLHALRADARTKGVEFILVTGKADQDIVEGGRRLGMNNFLKKPFTTREFRACIEAVVGPL